MRRTGWVLAAGALLLAGSVGAIHAQDETPMTRFLAENGAVPCEEDERFQCVTLTVPLDHSDPASSETVDVVFGVLPASDPANRRGMYVTVVGGPGGSGLHSVWYSDYFDPDLFGPFDIVFFDQRGMGRSQGVRCDQEALTYYLADDSDQEAIIEAAQQFATDCMAAINRPDLLPFLGTVQAAEDLEMFRAAVGDEQFWLYGESYGTQFAQTYAAAYPQHVAGLILDGVVDLTREGPDYYAEQDAAFENALQLSFEACAADPVCAGDFPGGDPRAVFDALWAQVSAGPIEVEVTLPDGTTETRQLTRRMVDAARTESMYTEYGRSGFLRELAAAAQGEYLPLLRHGYTALFVNPATQELEPDPGWSDGAYYAVDCSDYVYSLEQSDPVCPFWTLARPPQERPAPFTAPVPTLILNATADPATPIQNGIDVASRLPNAWSLTTQGGPHVVYGRGQTCPDDQVTAFLLTGETPDARESICDGVVIDVYEPLAEADPAWFTDILYDTGYSL
jgi:pimeloyl-ACP methyl ester carboxylesterase